MANNFDRRALLKGMAALPLVSAFQPFSQAMPSLKPPRTAAPATITQVNVLFHGLFAMVIGDPKSDPYVYVYPPKVDADSQSGDPGHVYLAGSAKSNADLTKGGYGETYTFQGVVGSCATYLPAPLIILPIQPPRPADIQAYAACTLKFPLPIAIEPLRMLRQIRPGDDFFYGNDAPQPPPKKFPFVVAFIYNSIDSNGSLQFNPPLKPFQPEVPTDEPDVRNIHVWAEPTDCVGIGHGMNAFKQLSNLLGSPQVDFNDEYINKAFKVDPDLTTDITGVGPAEERSLVEITLDQSCPELKAQTKKVGKGGTPPIRTSVPHLLTCGNYIIRKPSS